LFEGLKKSAFLISILLSVFLSIHAKPISCHCQLFRSLTVLIKLKVKYYAFSYDIIV